jgi:hypothetical protein
MLFVVNVAGIISRRGLRVFALAGILCAAGPAFGEGNPPPELPIGTWLQGQNRQDFPWHVELGQSWLTFQQRRYVQARITFRVRDLLRAGVSLRDLHLIVKLATEDGRWLQGQSYSRFEPPPGLGAGDEIHSLTNLYVRPGSYGVAVMAYDAANHRGNLWRGPLRVGSLKDDPLPGIDRTLPQVEFLPAALPLRLGRGRGLASMITFDPWALGQGELLLPVGNVRPVQVDIVANVSLSLATDRRDSEAPDWEYQLNGATVLQISNALSQLNLKAGCVRFSALDVRRQKVFADQEDARTLDWSRLRQAIVGLNRNKIGVSTLAGQKHEPAFLAHYLEKLSAAPSPCERDGPPPVHILIVVSDAFIFPNGTERTTVRPEITPVGLCYHLRLVPVAGARWDEIGTVLKPLHPLKVDFSDSVRFRKTLAQMITGIENASRETGQPARQED